MKVYFPIYDPDTKEPTDEEMVLEKIGEYNAVGPGGQPVKVDMFDETGFDWLCRYCHDTIKYGLQCPYIVTGLPGRGKSTLALKLNVRVRPKFELERVHFYLEDVLEHIEKDSPSDPSTGDFKIQMYDEAVTGLYNQDWQSAITNIKVLNVVRMKREMIGYLLPNLSDMNPKLLPMMQMWLYLYRKGVAEVLLPLQNKFDGSVFWKAIMAVQFGPEQGELWGRYEARKYDFIQRYTSSVNAGEIGSKKYIAAVNQRDELMEHVIGQNWMSVNEMAELMKVRQNTISTWRERRVKRLTKMGNVA